MPNTHIKRLGQDPNKNHDSGTEFETESGSDFGARFRPRFWGRIPAPNINSYIGPESGPKTKAGIRPSKWVRPVPKKCIYFNHFV